jgi:hypothetical protein
MNLKQLSILIVLVALVGGAGLYLYQRNTASWQGGDRAPEQKLLGDFPLNDITQVLIKQPTAELNLVKLDDRWKVKERFDYPANFSELSEFLRKMWELKGVQRIKVGASQLARLELVGPDKSTNGGTLVEFKDKTGKSVRSLLLGKKHMRHSEGSSPFGGDDSGWPDGRFVRVMDGQTTPNVWVVSDPFSNVEAKPESWVNKDFIKVEKLRSISLSSTNATNNWKLARETESGEWKLQDKQAGEELDSSKTSSFNYLLSSPSFNDVLSPETKPEAVGLDKPITATLETFDQFAYKLQIGKHTNDDNYPVRVDASADLPKERVPGKDEKPEDKERLDKEFKEKNDKLKEKLAQEKAFEKWTFIVSKWTIDSLLKPRADLLAPPKKEEPKKEEQKSEQPKEPAPKEERKEEPKESKPAEVKKVEAKPAEVKKEIQEPETPKATEPKKDEKDSSTNAPAPPAPPVPPVPPMPDEVKPPAK